MHHCLFISEILRNICDNTGQNTSLALALTCRSFLEPSLDRIWRELTSFDPLAACLDEDLWTTYEKEDGEAEKHLILHIRDNCEVTPEHLRVYLTRYANRIKSLRVADCYDASKPRITVLSPRTFNALQIATDFQLGALSPKLTRFHWMDRDTLEALIGHRSLNSCPPYSNLFVGQSTKHIGFENFDPSSQGSLDLASLKSTLRRLQKLESVKVSRNYGHSDSYQGLLVEKLLALTPWANLTSLTVPSVTRRSMHRLASLPQLDYLEISDLEFPNPQEDHSTPSPAEHGFQALTTLSVRGTYQSSLTDLFVLIPPNNRIRTLQFDSDDFEISKRPQQWVDLIVQRLNPSFLETLKVTSGSLSALRPLMDDQLDLEIGETADLSPLYSFKHLRHLKLRTDGGFRMTAETAQRLPHTWPHLTSFDILTNNPIGQNPQIDHNTVIDMLSSWRSLRILGLRFDGTRITGLEQGKPNSVTTLRVGESPISSHSRTLSWLKTNFPVLERVDARTPAWNSEHIMYKRWQKVIAGTRD